MKTLLAAGGESPVITKPPSGAYTYKVFDAKQRSDPARNIARLRAILFPLPPLFGRGGNRHVIVRIEGCLYRKPRLVERESESGMLIG